MGDKPVALPLDLASIRLDLDGDGKASDYETLGAMMQGIRPARQPFPPAQPLAVDFDTADIYWLRGYSSFVAAFAQLLLSNDFNASFDKTFHIYFPKAGLPMADKLVFNPELGDPMSNGNIADAISLVHLINWNVVEPERRKDVRVKLCRHGRAQPQELGLGPRRNRQRQGMDAKRQTDRCPAAWARWMMW